MFFLAAALLMAPVPVPLPPGQVLLLGARDPKVEKLRPASVVEIRGQRGLLVEARGDLAWDDRAIALDPDHVYEFYLPNPADPADLPYRWRRDGLEPVHRKRLLRLAGDEIAFLELAFPDESFASLAEEDARRQRELAALAAQRDAVPADSVEWRELDSLRRLRLARDLSWLRAVGFALAAEARRARAEDDASSERLVTAIAAIAAEEVPPSLVSADQELTGGRSGFQSWASSHFRVVADAPVGEERSRALLGLAESALEEFRLRHLDPWLDGRPDPIPDEVLVEFFFGPMDAAAFEGFLVLHYGQTWGPDAAAALRRRGRDIHQPCTPHVVEYWRHDARTSLEGIVLHGLGHALAELAYAGHAAPVSHDWLREGLGQELEWRWSGLNDVVCVAMGRDAITAVAAPAGESAALLAGHRGVLRELALSDPLPLSALLLRRLGELTPANVARACTLIEWLETRPDGRGATWLFALAEAGEGGAEPFLVSMGRESRRLLGAGGGGTDALAELDAAWREWLGGQAAPATPSERR